MVVNFVYHHTPITYAFSHKMYFLDACDSEVEQGLGNGGKGKVEELYSVRYELNYSINL